MTLDDRLLWLIVGIIIGFLLGYLTKELRDTNEKLDEIKKELDEVDDIVKHFHPEYEGREEHRRTHARDERGVLDTRVGRNVALAVVVLLTAIAAFRSQAAVNRVHDAQDQQRAISVCVATTLADTIKTLNLRTEFTRNQATANVDLQRAQSQLLGVLLHRPPYPDPVQRHAFHKYFHALNDFVHAYGQSENTADKNPYPTVVQFDKCLEQERSKGG